MANESSTDTKSPTSRRRRLVIGTNVLVQIFAVLAVAIMVNWLVSRHYTRFDWTKSGYYKLSEKTKQVLAGLKEPVDVIVFLPPSDRGQKEYVEKVLEDVRNLLGEFRFHGGSKLRVEYVDPDRDLGRARQLVEKFKLDSPDVVIFASGDRHKYVRLDEMVDVDTGQYYMGGPPRIKAFKGEGVFLSAIQTVSEEESPKIYFLTGHGEHDPEDVDQRDGYSELSRYIKRDNITVQKWNLLEKQQLPADAGAVVIAGPRKPFTDSEINLLDQYLKNKGRLFVLLDPHTQTGLETLLQRWDVQAENDLAVAKGGLLLGTELIVVDALGSEYAPHPITAKLAGINTSFPYTRSIRAARRSQGGSPDQPHVTELVKTPPSFWGETDADTQRTQFDAEQDIKGPLPLAVAVETSKPTGVDVNIGLSRAVVVGTSRFIDNGNLGGGNLDFFMNSLNWLLQREQLVAVSPKLPEEFSLDISPNQQRAVYALVIAGMPLTVAIIGILVWLGRRK